VVLVRVMERAHQEPSEKSSSSRGDDTYEVEQLGTLTPSTVALRRNSKPGTSALSSRTLKRVADARMGDTVIEVGASGSGPAGNYEAIKPMVFAGTLSGACR